MKVVIDGYNLIFECGLHGKRVSADSLARSRQRLLATIARLQSAEQQSEIAVVFDAQKQMLSGQQELELFQQIRVYYSINYADADAMIEYLIGQHTAPRQLTVVSSDHRIQKAALRRKAKPIDSGDWYDNLLAGKLENAKPENRTGSGQDVRKEDQPNHLLSESELDSLKADIERERLLDDNEWFDF